jgi:hypothetical protein
MSGWKSAICMVRKGPRKGPLNVANNHGFALN